MKKTLYDILELSRSASVESVQAAYERLSQAAQSRSAAGDPDASARIVAIREAYATLSDSARKSLYDLRLSAAAATPEPEMLDVPDEDAARRRLIIYAAVAVVLLVLVFGSIRMYTNHQAGIERERLQKLEALEKQRLELDRQRLDAQREAENRRLSITETVTGRGIARQDQYDDERRRRQQDSERAQYERQREADQRRLQLDERQRQREEQAARDRERMEAERRLRADKELLRQTCMQRYNRPDC